MQEKQCSKCGEVKPISEFYKKERGLYGVDTHCKLCRLQANKEWRDRNKGSGQWEENRRQYGREYTQKRRLLVIEHYGNKCECCGEERKEFLSIDHINGNGRQHRKKVGKGKEFYNWLIKKEFPEGFRVLCHNCNMSLGIYGYCPHQREK